MRPMRLIPILLLTTACQFSFDRALAPGELRGTVVFDSGNGVHTPVPGARIVLENSPIAVTADARGNFVVGSLPPATYALTITASHSGTGAIDSGLRLQNITLGPGVGALGDGRDLGVVVIGALGGLGGTVTAAGAPVSAATVVLTGLAHTDTKAGGFTFPNLVPGSYQLGALAQLEPGSTTVSSLLTVTVSPRAITQVGAIDLAQGTQVSDTSPGGSLSGQAQLSGADSSQGITMMLTSPQAAGTALPAVSTSDVSGDYSATELPAGVYTVTATLGGFESVSVSSVFVGASTTTIPLITLFQLKATGGSGPGIAGGCATASACSASAQFFSPAASCPATPSSVLSALQAAPDCSAAAAALTELADCVATSECAAFLQPEGACADAFASFSSAAAMAADCTAIAAPLLGGGPADGGTDGGMADGGGLPDAGVDAGFGDAGTVDAGASGDAGTSPDAGTSSDGGTLSDAGITSDAGVASDAGTSSDAGNASSDAGAPDSGAVDAGPVYSCDVAGNQACPNNMICNLNGVCATPQHTVNGNGTVTDNVTGLVWQQTTTGSFYWDPTGVNSASAQYYCENLNLGGISSGWRAPTISELYSLVELGRGYPLIDQTAFPGTSSNIEYWSSSPQAGGLGFVWVVAFGPATVVAANSWSYSSGLNVRCVYGTSSANTGPTTTCNPLASQTCSDGMVCDLSGVCVAPQYVVNADGGTVSDLNTGLLWQQTWDQDTFDWDQTGSNTSSAQYYCANLSLGGHSSGWRLPTVAEAFSLIEMQTTPPQVEHTAFPSMPTNTGVLTSTPYGPVPSWPWIVGFDLGASLYTTDASDNGALCVWAGSELDGGPSIGPATMPPAAPGGVYAVAGEAKATINWDDVPGASSYNLYYSTTSGTGTAGTRMAGVSTAFTLTGLTDETTYFIVVTAVNADGESAPSVEVRVTPQPDVPPAPTGVTAVSGFDQITYNWQAAPSAVSYNVYFSTTEGSGTSGYERGMVSAPYTLASLGAATTYYAVVTSVNNLGVEGPPSAEVTSTTLAPAPSPVFVTGENQQVVVQWTAVTGATSYDLYYSTTSSSPLTGTVVQNAVSPYTVTGLANGTPCSIAVASVNAGGQNPSATVSATPSLVWGVQAVAGNATVALTWSPVAGASGYNVYRSTTNGFAPAAGNLVGNATTPKLTDANVTNYTEYFYRVTAVVSAVESAASPQVSGTPVVWKMVSTSGDDTFGITGDGRLWVWGTDFGRVGVLGLGSGTPGPVYSPTPIGSQTNWTDVSASVTATFAVGGGAMYGWGSDENVGCLGQGTTLTSPVFTPLQVGTATSWTSVNAYATSTCGILGVQSSGTVWDWGDLIGVSPEFNNITDTPQETGSGGFKFVTFGYGGEAAFGLTSAGGLYSWGIDYGSGVLGLGNVGFSVEYSSPQRVGSLSTWTAVASGYQNTVGIAGGALYTWGWDANEGLLAQGTASSNHQYTPAQVGTATDWTAVAAAGGACLAIGGGSLYAWGTDSGYGVLGLGSASQTIATPTQVGTATNWVSVASSATGEAVFAVDSDGNLWAWGNNADGALGFAQSVTNAYAPTQVSVP